jgi:ABC-type amino acid transport substrate-binding protein
MFDGIADRASIAAPMRILLLLLSAAVFMSLAPQVSAQAPGSKIRVVTRNLGPFSFEKDGRRLGFAFALQQGSPLREQLNQALLKLSEQGVGNELRKKYFGEEQ